MLRLPVIEYLSHYSPTERNTQMNNITGADCNKVGCRTCQYWNLRYQLGKVCNSMPLIKWWEVTSRERARCLEVAINQLEEAI